MLYLQLFYEFFKTGLFAVGGGLATLPFLYTMSADTHWFNETDITNMLAISQSTPGPLGVNMSTYVGFLTGGILGGLVASVGLIFPSFVIILLISKILDKFKHSTLVQNIFYTLRPASTALIASAGLSVAEIAFLSAPIASISHWAPGIINWWSVLFGACLWAGIRFFKLHPIVYIAISAAIGILFRFSS